jgi:hypothetical protein
MDYTTLTRQIRLHPRASLLKGEFFERKKAGGTFSAVIPHYATSGIPMVQFEATTGDPINIQGHGAEIELNFRENDPSIQSITTRHFSNHILVQLMYGKKGESASKAACKVLHEASTCFAKLMDKKQELYLAGLFVLKVSGGSSDGLLVPLGVFNLDGVALWINPEAIELNLLSASFPNTQIEQSSKDEAHWYDRIRDSLRHLFQDKELHDRILESRAGALLESGKVKTKKAGMTLAAKEAKILIAKTAGVVLPAKISVETSQNITTKQSAKISRTKALNKAAKTAPARTFSIKQIRGDGKER